MDPTSDQDLLQQLQQIDTCTICDAIELLDVRGRLEGSFSMDTRCLLPHLGVMVGYAITVLVDASTPDEPRSSEVWETWLHAMENGPRPGVLVFKDVGPQPRRAAHFGEQMSTLAGRFGMVGIVTDGGVRDIQALDRKKFHAFGPGVVPTHGNPRLLEVNVPVTIDGVHVRPGDLLHGDANGLTTFPAELAPQVLQTAVEALEEDRKRIDFFAGQEFTIERLVARYLRE